MNPWICPKCSRVHGPMVQGCSACNQKVERAEQGTMQPPFPEVPADGNVPTPYPLGAPFWQIPPQPEVSGSITVTGTSLKTVDYNAETSEEVLERMRAQCNRRTAFRRAIENPRS